MAPSGTAPRRRAPTPSFLLVALLVLLAPVASAHVQHDRPRVQATEELRGVHIEMDGPKATFEYLLRSDPTVDFVRHVVDARRGAFTAEYRPFQSDASTGFAAQFSLARIVEYRDQNRDGAYQPGNDPMIRTWTPGAYAWNVTGPQQVRVADVQARLVRFEGNTSGSPTFRLEAAAAGAAFVDEGATVRQQDIILYLDLGAFPKRGTGNLHAIEGLVRPPPGATVRTIAGENFTAGVAVETPTRLALLDWGAEGVVDGKEARLLATLDPPAADGTSTFRIHLPLLDESLRLVLVSAVEYAKEDKRADGPAAGLLVALLAVLAQVRPARRR